MKEFYKACEKAIGAKQPATAVKYLRTALDIMQPMLSHAKTRLELWTVADLQEHMRWTVAWCVYNQDEGRGRWPGLVPIHCGVYGHQLVFPPASKQKSSLTYRWSKVKEWPETMLPRVPMRTWPFFPDEAICEFAR